MSFAGPLVLDVAWPEFLKAAVIAPADPDLPDRVESLHVLRMLELLASPARVSPEIRRPPFSFRRELGWVSRYTKRFDTMAQSQSAYPSSLLSDRHRPDAGGGRPGSLAGVD